MIEALKRIGIPKDMYVAIQALYEGVDFFVKAEGNVSQLKKQATGIRQGCPLSPYLFLIVMTVMFHDIYQRCRGQVQHGMLPRFTFMELLYADDTMLVGNSARAINRLLLEIEIESGYYNLRLNRTKCLSMCMYGSNHIHFQDGTVMKQASEVTYLGGTLTKDVQPKVEIQNRIGMAMEAVRSLEGLWKHTSCSVKWKINVYNAVVVSKLLYGLETVQMPPSVMKQLDVFQMRGLRKILGMQPSYIDRSNSNEEVFRKLREDHQLPHIPSIHGFEPS